MNSNPFLIFSAWFQEAKHACKFDPTMMALATATLTGKPSIRTVLLKSFDERGFVFYTNLQSQKAKELEKNPQAALCFYWNELDKQVRIEGKVEIVTDKEADDYFATRPRESQIGAWASKQSTIMHDDQELHTRFHEEEQRFTNHPISRPPFWSGFRLIPEKMEFWERGTHRLHKRTCYRKISSGNWMIEKLYP